MSNEEDIGYKKPPKDSQFKPGESGNPQGRPAIPKDAQAIISKILNEVILVKENGKFVEMKKGTVILRRLRDQALLKGDVRAAQRLLKLQNARRNSPVRTEFIICPPDLLDGI